MDHNQDRQTILRETQNREYILSREVLSLKDEKTKQVSNLMCCQFKWGSWNPIGAFPWCRPETLSDRIIVHLKLHVYLYGRALSLSQAAQESKPWQYWYGHVPCRTCSLWILEEFW